MMAEIESPNSIPHQPEANPYAILQHLQSVAPALSARGVSAGRGRRRRSATRAALRVGGSSSRCCSASSARPTRCARSVGGLASCEGRLAHLGITAPSRSTLAYANEHRPWQLYQAVFYQLLARCQAVAPGKKFRFKNKLLSLDATMIDLCAEMFPWATFRRTKGAVKLHFTLDHDGYLPTVLVITEGKRRETPVARQQHVCARHDPRVRPRLSGSVWFADLTAAGVFFVTRLRTTARYRVVARRPVPQHRGIVADQEFAFAGTASRRQYPRPTPPRRAAHARRRSAGVPDQSSDARRLDRRSHLSGPLANRALLQSPQAEPAGEDVCRDVRQRAAHSDLDRADRAAAAEIPPAEGHASAGRSRIWSPCSG